jgi:hypothetical protein
MPDEETNYYAQWTGRLFKGKAPVVFNFITPSFGCHTITFLDKEKLNLPLIVITDIKLPTLMQN